MSFKTKMKVLMMAVTCVGASMMPGFSVQAMQLPATSLVQYVCEPKANFFSMNSLDFRADGKPLPTSENLFVNSTGNAQPQQKLKVTDCTIANQNLTLSRVFINVPDLNGNLCGTLDWGVFQIKAGDQLISEFISGCSFDIHVFTNEYTLHVCKSDFNKTLCKTLLWKDIKKGGFTPIRIGLLGDWL